MNHTDERLDYMEAYFGMALPQYTLSNLVSEYVYADYLTTEEFIGLVDRVDEKHAI